MPDLIASAWFALAAPPGTPDVHPAEGQRRCRRGAEAGRRARKVPVAGRRAGRPEHRRNRRLLQGRGGALERRHQERQRHSGVNAMDIRHNETADLDSLARRLRRPRPLLGLPGPGELHARAGPPVRGPDLELRLSRGRHPEQRRLPHQLRGRAAGDRGARCRRHHQLLRESLRPPRRDDRARRRRQRREQFQVHLPRLELRPRRQPARHRLRARHQRRGRHAQGFQARELQPEETAHHHPVRPGVRDALRRDAADRRVSRRGDPGAHQARAQPADQGHGALHPGAAQQLETLRRERQGHLPCEPAAPVLRHIPHHAPDAGRRRAGQSRRRPSRQLHDRQGRRPPEHGLSRPGSAQREQGLHARRPAACSTRSRSSATTSSCRSSRSFRASSCSRSTIAWPCARSCRAAPAGWTSCGPTSALPTIRPR